MTRTTATLDRIATFVVALALILVGVLFMLWRLDRWVELPEQLQTSSAARLMEAGWWPFAIGALGLLLAFLGLRWLWAHIASSGVREVSLPGSGKHGHLSVDAKAAASAAADALAQTPGVRTTNGKAVRQRGQLVVDLSATVDFDAALPDIARSADQVASELARVLERPDIYCRVRIGVSPQSGGRRLR